MSICSNLSTLVSRFEHKKKFMIFINSNLKIATFGSTHEKEVGVLIEGMPINFNVDMDSVQDMLDRRRPGSSELVSKRSEADIPQITSGLEKANGKNENENENIYQTTGDMIRAVFANSDVKDAANDHDYVPRPGHGDFTYFMNTGKFEKGATSARSTVGIVFAGAICKQLLAERGIFVNAKLLSPSEKEIKAAMSEGDSLGGLVECSIIGLPAGFGNPLAEKIESKIGSCVFNIPGVRGLEFGAGFDCLKYKGSEFNDSFVVDENKKVRLATNNCGGLLGGMATGSPVVFRACFKPTASISKEQESINLMTLESVKLKVESRNDPCIAVRGAVVIEAAAAIAIADIILGKY